MGRVGLLIERVVGWYSFAISTSWTVISDELLLRGQSDVSNPFYSQKAKLINNSVMLSALLSSWLPMFLISSSRFALWSAFFFANRGLVSYVSLLFLFKILTFFQSLKRVRKHVVTILKTFLYNRSIVSIWADILTR